MTDNDNKLLTEHTDKTRKEKKNNDRQQELNKLQSENDIKFVMSSAKGRRFVWALLCECGIYGLSFRNDGYTDFREGMRNIGLMYLAKAGNLAPQDYIKMMNESVGTDVKESSGKKTK